MEPETLKGGEQVAEKASVKLVIIVFKSIFDYLCKHLIIPVINN